MITNITSSAHGHDAGNVAFGEAQRKAKEGEAPNERATPSGTVSISKEGKEALSNESASNVVGNYLESNLGEILEKTFTDLVDYPSPLAAKLDDESLSAEEHSQAMAKLNQREHEAFGKYARSSPPDMEQYFLKYVEYLDSLPPEELNSSRYVGQRAQAVRAYEQVASSNGNTPADLTDNQDPVLTLLEMIREEDLKAEELREIRGEYDTRMAPILSRENSADLREKYDEAIESLSFIIDQLEDLSEPSNPAFGLIHEASVNGAPVEQIFHLFQQTQSHPAKNA